MESRLTDIDHVGIAVRDIDAAITWYAETLGGRVVHREDVERDGVREAMIEVGDSFIQLLTPTRPDSPVATFLERRGEGLHHVAYRVPNCAEALDAARAAGARLIDETPRAGSRATTIAFLHPQTSFATLIELVEVPRSLRTPR